jgi:serine acetyltransferase
MAHGVRHPSPRAGGNGTSTPYDSAEVFGKITVGHDVKIGANTVIYPDIPNPDIPNPDIPNPDIPNPDIPNMAVAAMKTEFEILTTNGNQP